MSSKDKNLSNYNLTSTTDKVTKDLKIAIVTAEWNEKITHSLKDACIATLLEHGVEEKNINSISVPGAFELPFGARMMLSQVNPDAVICLGCVIKGETKHDEYINHAVATGIMSLGLTSGKPIIFGVLTPDNMEQAKDRAGGKHGNKGVEAAITALQMTGLKNNISHDKKRIGFS